MIYYLSVLFLFQFSLLKQANLKKSEIQLLVAFSFFYLLLLGGLRFEVGADWVPYEDLFFYISSWHDITSAIQEPLYLVFSYVIKIIFNDYSVFVFIFFLISFSFKFQFIRLYSPDIFLSLIVYIYTIFLIYDVNVLRQGMALGLSMLSIKYILDRNIYKFIILIIVASLFHLSAIIIIPFYYLSRIKINNKIIVLSLFLILAISMPLRSLLQNSHFFQALLTLDSFKHYAIYTTNEGYNLNIPIISIAVFQRVFIFLLFIVVYNKIRIKEEIKLLLRNGYFIGIVIFLILSFSSEFSARLSFAYKALEIIMIPLIVCSSPKFYQRVFLLVLFTTFAIVGLSRLLDIPNGCLIPYQNILLPVF